MTDSQPTTQPGVLDDAGLRRVVWVLSLTEITSWGVLYYAFPVLLSSIAADTGWSTTALTGAFSLSLVVAAGVGIFVGRHIDRRGPRLVMSAGSALAVVSVVVVATAPTYPVFLIGWLLIGVAMAGVLYAPAFAALTHWAGSRRVTALTTLTLVAGLASTVFAPLTAAINSVVDWRETYLVLVVLLAAITLPAHWYGLRQPWGHGTTSTTCTLDQRVSPSRKHPTVHPARGCLRDRIVHPLRGAHQPGPAVHRAWLHDHRGRGRSWPRRRRTGRGTTRLCQVRSADGRRSTDRHRARGRGSDHRTAGDPAGATCGC